jgi:hypothetical protein
LKEPKYLRPVLATFVWALPYAFRNVVAPDDTSITLTISGESGGGWTLLRQKSGWGLSRGEAIAPDAEIILDEEMAWRYFTRGFEAHQAREIIKIKGNKRFAELFFRAVAIIA